LSNKLRIHDLAKKYGMSGKDMAAKLRDLGFTKARSHMSALDEFEQLRAEGILQAYGIVPDQATVAPEDPVPGGGLVLRKKKKKKAIDPVGTGTTEAEEPLVRTEIIPELVEHDPEPRFAPAVAEAAPVETVPEPVEPAVVAEPVVAEPVAAAEAVVAPEPQIEVPDAATPEISATSAPTTAPPAPVAESTPQVEPTPAPKVTEPTSTGDVAAKAPEPTTEAPAPVAASTTETAPAPADTPPSAATPSEPAVVETAASGAAPAPSAIVPTPTAAAAQASAPKPAAAAAAAAGPPKAKPRGNVVGFIDPSKFQASQPVRRKTMSRRLQSRDDATPDVRPTYTHGRGPVPGGGGGPRGNLTAAQLRERESGRFLRRNRGGNSGGGRGGRGRGRGMVSVLDSPMAGQTVTIQAPTTLSKLAEAMKLKANVVLKTALQEGIGMLNINAALDEDTASLLADAFDVELNITREVAAEEALLTDLRATRAAVDDVHLAVRPPTVAFLGHVDHGKTTLIDCIRASRVADNESGGITQHIGAYQVSTKLGHKLTIVDTPGHAAFTAMRARGARAVDIVVLVVAGDDGVKPSTEEAYNHAKAAGAPIIVAITKKDRPQYDSQKTQTQLATMGLNPEEWGGETAMIQVSALENDGVEELLERVFLEGELLDLKAHPDGAASGTVIEAEKQQGKGIVAHLLVRDGTLRAGDVILAGEGYGKVRSMHNDLGEILQEAGPSMPVEVAGLDALPGVGMPFHVVEKLAKAKEVATERERSNRAITLAESRGPNAAMDAILGKSPKVEVKSVNLIIRADVQGSVEVLKHALSELQHDEVGVKIVHIGVGPITESDVDLATTSDALLVAFHVGVGSKARTSAEQQGLRIVRFEVIYELLDQVHDLMEGTLSPEFNEKIIGHVEIRRLFKSSRIGLIAGCYVIDGSITRDAKIRLLRDDAVVYTGKLGSLKREAEDARVVREGFECGIVLHNYGDIREGDIIEGYRMVEVKRTLEGSAKKSKSSSPS
jgi:translation initiation factor IF-2